MAAFIFRPKRFAKAVFIGCDEARGRRENVFRRAVIPFEANDLCAFEIFLKSKDIINLRTAPAVNGLVIIANHADIIGALCE